MDTKVGGIIARTFARDKEFIASFMQVDIEYNAVTRKYTLVNKEDVEKNTLYKYLLGVFHMNGISSLSMRLKDRMMLEEIPTGVDYLPVLLKAMEEGKVVQFDYQSYYSKESLFHFEIIPCFIRLFKQRWYLIGEYLDRSRTRVLALERMQNLVTGDKKIAPSPDILPGIYYHHHYGIIHTTERAVEIQLKVYGEEYDYIVSTPFHCSQKEIEKKNDYAVISLYLVPTLDFKQSVLSHGDGIEVLSPVSFREEIKQDIQRMFARYTE
ncbi:MAG: WYL domain-containing protein [Tannerellaceae bacterium]|nr:WYL domain-containing protein [Tannerellaceae bacterium]